MSIIHVLSQHTELRQRYLALRPIIPEARALISHGQYVPYLGASHCSEGSYTGASRAIANVEIGGALVQGTVFEGGGYLLKGTGKHTMDFKMKEAVWQFDVIVDTTQAATIGCNFHEGPEGVVASITNIQGRDKASLDELRTIRDGTPWPPEAIGLLVDGWRGLVPVVRGIASQSHPMALQQNWKPRLAKLRYDKTFVALGMRPQYTSEKRCLYYETKPVH